jgi:hypothetical protein
VGVRQYIHPARANHRFCSSQSKHLPCHFQQSTTATPHYKSRTKPTASAPLFFKRHRTLWYDGLRLSPVSTRDTPSLRYGLEAGLAITPLNLLSWLLPGTRYLPRRILSTFANCPGDVSEYYWFNSVGPQQVWEALPVGGPREVWCSFG